MPRKSNKSKQLVEQVESTNNEVEQVQPTNETGALSPPNRDQYLKARALIQLYRENQKNRPKRKCSEKQLAALAEGRSKNKRCQKKTEDHESI